jgi:parallel beta-helix repeat protein
VYDVLRYPQGRILHTRFKEEFLVFSNLTLRRSCFFSSGLASAALLLALTFVNVATVQAQSGRTFYVAATGNDANSGSSSVPFRQIRKAVSVAIAGDTILVGDGNYLGFDVRNKNGIATAPITIKATGTGAVVTVTTDRSDNRDTIFITSSSYIVVDGLRSGNANRAAMRIDVSPHITVRNCVFGNNARWGIFTDFSDDTLLENNECYGSVAEHGVYISNSSDRPTIRGNSLHDNYACGLHMNGDLSAGGDGIISGAIVEKNVIYNNGAGGGSAINMDGVQDSLICNNLLFNNRATGIGAYRIDAAQGPKGLQVINNTVDVASNGRWALMFNNTAGMNFARNNILYNRNTARGGITYLTSADVANVDSDYNILDRVTPNDGSTRYTLTQWQAQGRELHSLSVPLANLFVNPTTADYHLLANSPAIDHGTTVTNVPTDRDGLPRPSGATFDIGCYEVQSAPTSNAAATFVRTDTATRGSWIGNYGRDGYNLAGVGATNPLYGSAVLSNNGQWTWSDPTSDVRGLTKPGDTSRIASCWYAGSSFNIRTNLTDGAAGNTHQVSLYLLDWDNYGGGRQVRVEAWDTVNNTKLGEQAVSAFQNGAYSVWTIKGDVTFRIVNLNGSSNAVASGVFFDPTGSTSSGGATATFVRNDTTTRGSWVGVYGQQGYSLAGASAVNPSFASVSLANQSQWTWSDPTSDVRGLTKPGSSNRIASCWYAGSSFDVRANCTDTNTHQVSLYLLDWDNYNGGRQVRVEAWDTATNTKLGEQVVSAFQNGVYSVWNVKGDVTFKVVNLNGSSNAVASALFFD